MNMGKKTGIGVVMVAIAALVGGGGYYLWHQQKGGGEKLAGKATQGKVEYTCPMHPFIIKDKPGTCPICGMELVKKVEGAQAGTKEMAELAKVSLSPTQQVMANVAAVKVNRLAMSKDINAVGIVAYDQSRQAKVTAWVAGRIDRLHVNKVGDLVTTKRPVAEIYSPELVSSQQEYLLALKSREQLKDSPIGSISRGGEGLVASARQRLKLYGVKESQIAELEKAGQPTIRLPIYTPLSGVVIEKMALEGQYVNVGDPLFTIADLSVVWVEAEVYENELPFLKVGQRAEIASPSATGANINGRVSFIYPFLDPKTRTVKVRIEIPNPGLRLKPDMFVSATIKVPLGESLVVPVTAVLDTGNRQMVWIETKPGIYEPRDVKVGARVGDNVQVLSGLLRGDKVVASGGYLIDSESQLKGGAGGHAGHGGVQKEEKGGAPPAGHEGHPPAPVAPKKNEMDMGDMKM